MKRIVLAVATCLLLSFNLQSEALQNPKLLQALKSSSRWIILPLVEDSEKGSKLASNSKDWVYEKESQLQDLDREVVTLSKKEMKKATQLWSNPFSSRIDKKLIDLCNSLESNLLTAYYDPSEPNEFTYVVYSLSKKRQLVFRTQMEKTKTTSKIDHPKKVEPAKPSLSKEVQQPKKVEPSKPSIEIADRSGVNFKSEVSKWFETKSKTENTRITKSDRRQRNSNHPDVRKRGKSELHDFLMKSKKLIAYADKEKAKGHSQLEAACIENLKLADKSWMSSSKFEHLSRAYVLNQYLKTPNEELKSQLLLELVERQTFLNDWDNDVYR